jgi:hypothetical protein
MPGIGGAGSLLSQLGSTLRLGVEVVNAALAGSARMLNGMSGLSYGAEPGWYPGGCGSDCCGQDCCGQDCCGGCEPCCEPSVGRCC